LHGPFSIFLVSVAISKLLSYGYNARGAIVLSTIGPTYALLIQF
jgi:hypothetical protein